MAICGHLRVTMQGGKIYDCPLAADQNTTVEDGALTIGHWHLGNGHFRVYVWNTDAPTISSSDPYSVATHPPTLIRSVEVAVPEGARVVDASLRLAERITETHPTFDAWSLIGPQTPRPRHSAFPQAGGSSASGFLLNGGHRLFWDVLATHYEKPEAPRENSIARRVLRLEAQDLMESRLPSSLRLFYEFWGPSPTRYTIDDWVVHRFGGRKPWQGPIDFGHIQWGEGHSNHHYDMIGHAVRAALLGVPRAWEVASRMALAHLQTGVYATDHGRYAWCHVDEKTGGKQEYPGDARVPHSSHEWDEGLIAWAVMSGDETATSWLTRRASKLLSKAATKPHEVWNGAGGARLLGWYVRNLTAFHRAAIRDMSDACAELLKHARTTNASNREWKNVYTGSRGFAPWMQSLTNSAILDACADDGPMASQEDRQAMLDYVRPMVEWQCREIVGEDGVSPHWVPAEDDRSQDVYRYRTTQAAWAIPQLWHAVNTLGMSEFGSKLDAARGVLTNCGEGFDEYATGNGGGPGWLKTISSWGVSALDERFWA